MNKKVSVLAFQGGVIEHIESIKKLKINVCEVRTPEDLKNITHLIIPGGESPVIGRFLESSGLKQAIIQKYKSGKLAIWGTCAGAILLGKDASPYSLNLIDAKIERNAYGRQIASFNKKIFLPFLNKNFNAIFIRAPIIKKIGGRAQVLAKCDKQPILCQQNKILISTFHPELTDSTEIHKYFINL